MPSISRYYGLSGPLEFLDVDVANDNRLFLDPHAIRMERGPSPFARQAKKCITTFFDEILACVISGRQRDAERGLDLLQHFNEPKETRLGLSQEGFDGRGGDEDVGAWIWQVLNSDLEALIKVGVLKWIEDVPVFVEGIDKDITSDLTTRIIFEPLAKFTQSMAAKYPQFTRGTHEVRTVERQVWSPSRSHWRRKPLELPIAWERPLLLVPKYWARPRLLMSSGRYYETSLLSYVQRLRSTRDRRTGKLLKDPKWRLKERSEYERGQETIHRVTKQAKRRDEDLLSQFRDFVDQRYERLDDEELERQLRDS
jgi:hypothetical protein